MPVYMYSSGKVVVFYMCGLMVSSYNWIRNRVETLSKTFQTKSTCT